MRDILFRGKRIDNGEWIVGSLLIDPDTKSYSIYGFDYYSTAEGLQREPFCTIVNPSTIGQYTGCCDKNDKRVFEGDILKITDEFENSVIWSVDCKNTAFSINQKGVNYSTYLGEYDTGRCDIEIIGNIYDTPELFEVKE